MFCKSSSLLISRFGGRCLIKMEYGVIKAKDKSLSSLFFDERNQSLMRKLTSVDYDKVFKPKMLGHKLKAPYYKFLTNEELEAEAKKAEEKAEYYLQCPPVLDVPEDKTQILSEDATLDGHDESHAKLVFTDISDDLHPMERTVVIREPNGILRTGNRHEKKRMNQTYFPMEGRELHTPKMFRGEHFEDLLKRKEYNFILDRACIQFDPDEEEYHEILSRTYDAVDSLSEFEALDSTRHFGTMAFYLAINKKIYNLMKHFLAERKLPEASYLVHLYRSIHEGVEGEVEEDAEAAARIVEEFIAEPSNQMAGLIPDFNECLRCVKDRRDISDGVKRASGL